VGLVGGAGVFSRLGILREVKVVVCYEQLRIGSSNMWEENRSGRVLRIIVGM
jgi:hypothetical protein